MSSFNANYNKQVNVQPVSFYGTATLDASTKQGSRVTVNFVTDVTQPDESTGYIQAPASAGYGLYDIYLTSTPTVDGRFQFSIDGIDQTVTFGLASLTLKSLQYPLILGVQAGIVVQPNGKLRVFYVPNSNPSTTTTVTVEAGLFRIPEGFKGSLPNLYPK